MNKKERQTFYKAMDAKFNFEDAAADYHSVAGQIVIHLDSKQSYELLASAYSFESWLASTRTQIEITGKSTSGIDSALRTIANRKALISEICAKFSIAENDRIRRTEAVKTVRRLGFKRCSAVLSTQESFQEWLAECQSIARQRHKKKFARKATSVIERKETLKDYAYSKRKATLKDPISRARQAFLDQLDWQYD